MISTAGFWVGVVFFIGLIIEQAYQRGYNKAKQKYATKENYWS